MTGEHKTVYNLRWCGLVWFKQVTENSRERHTLCSRTKTVCKSSIKDKMLLTYDVFNLSRDTIDNIIHHQTRRMTFNLGKNINLTGTEQSLYWPRRMCFFYFHDGEHQWLAICHWTKTTSYQWVKCIEVIGFSEISWFPLTHCTISNQEGGLTTGYSYLYLFWSTFNNQDWPRHQSVVQNRATWLIIICFTHSNTDYITKSTPLLD